MHKNIKSKQLLTNQDYKKTVRLHEIKGKIIENLVNDVLPDLSGGALESLTIIH